MLAKRPSTADSASMSTKKDAYAMTKEPHGRAGGEARAEILPPKRRSEIAQNAAVARWGPKMVYASHRGNFKDRLGIDVDCYVLADNHKTAMISQLGMAAALGLKPRGQVFLRFVNSQAMADSVSTELRKKLENPLRFQAGGRGTGEPPAIVYGLDATLLIDICNAISDAASRGKFKGKGTARYQPIIHQAQIIIGASAKSGIRDLVYALSGYSPSTEEVIAAFKAYVQEEARKYEPEFPAQLYMEWHRLYEIPIPVRGRPWHFKHLTVNHIYHPLANSSGRVLELLRALRANDGDRQKKLFQFLNEIGARALRMHIGRVLEMAEDSDSKDQYEQRITRRFGRQLELDLIMSTPSTALPPPSAQSPGAAPG